MDRREIGWGGSEFSSLKVGTGGELL
jgi:hypothetical protein